MAKNYTKCNILGAGVVNKNGYTFLWGVPIRWTGPLDWTTGLTFDLRCQTTHSPIYCARVPCR